MRLLCWAAPSQTISSFRLSCARRALKNSTICALLTAPSYRRNKKFERVRPATAETCLQLKWELHDRHTPLGSPGADSSRPLRQTRFVDETISRRSAAHFF